ncbi:MAG: bifunctional (p)ppGpp synthetase/guanosine-3',5'-bis(diphosphate) 3'-pyrophosphohydrolase [Thermodesulfobacteriales bacterium]|nr:MAG: bifunctional (p)ppGpp synthetase/guanosine-3',5'-bis(diphosphate) 3'-pyrophosphohydrolase [Thermodesulfobacteriales bacterium]
MIRLNDIIENVNGYLHLTEKDIEMIKKAYVYSAKVHSGQKRSSGEPYLSHPLEVSGILSHMKLDVSSIITGLLHDTVEDTLATSEEIESMFGKEIASLVEGVTKIGQLPYTSKIERQAEGFRKLILATAKDIRVVLVKLADRLHNMRTLEHLSADRQKRIASETFDIYAPMSHRLGINWVTTELEDLSFRYLNPDEYKILSEQIAKKRKAWEAHVEDSRVILAEKLSEFDLSPEITGRFKHIYGIYRKMQEQNLDFEHIYDVIAFRLITNSLKECYETLGAVHASWKPVPGRFKDYIALPKGNGYQSLHTTVIGPFGERMEIQIRTRAMHEVSESGVASHWKYKEGKLDGGGTYEIYATLRQLLEWKDIQDPTEYMEAIKGELIADLVYVFTPNGDLKELPTGATPIDFAYSIHTEVGNKSTRANVNGKLVPLNHQLKTGDRVEIVTSKEQHPNRDWLKFVVTSGAKTKIRNWLRTEERKQSEIVGKSICERKFKQHGLDFQAMVKKGDISNILPEFKVKDVKDLYLAVGFGKISANDLLKKAVPLENLDSTSNKERIEKIIKTITSSSDGGVLVRGYDDVMIRFANCCSPLPGEEIVGYITRGKGITIHRNDCPRLLEVDLARRIDVEWDAKFKGSRPARILVTCTDRPGILSSITKTFSTSEVNISKAEIHSTDVEDAIGTFDVVVSDLSQLEDVINSIKKVKGVKSVERMQEIEAL